MKTTFIEGILSKLGILSSAFAVQSTIRLERSDHISQVSYKDDDVRRDNRLRNLHDQGVKNLIFDLGNVIVDLDIAKADELLFKLTGSKYEEASEEDLKIFHDFEKGLISESIFLNYFIKKSEGRAQAIDIINAWNAMLVNIPWNRLEMMRHLMQNYQVFILSNTNETHIRWTNHYIQTRYREAGFKSFVHHALYSHDLHARKPDAEIFEKVLQTYDLNPQETVFYDDNLENIQAANQIGIQAIQVHPDDEILAMVGDLPHAHVSKKTR